MSAVPGTPAGGGPPDGADRADDIAVEALGAALRVHCADPDLRRELARLLADLHPAAADRPATDRPEVDRLAVDLRADPPTVRRDDGRIEPLAPGPTLAGVLAAVNAALAERMTCFGSHAGVVALGDAAIAFPARSGAGKSTLVAACLQAGFDYVSDEVLAVPWSARSTDTSPAGIAGIVGYPRPLGLSPWSLAAARGGPPAPAADGVAELFLTARDLGARVRRPPPALRHVVLLDRIAAEPRLTALPRGRVAAALLARSFNAWRRPGPAFDLVHRIAAAVSCWSLCPGPPGATAALLRDRLG